VNVGYAVGEPSDTGTLGPAREDHVRFVFEATHVTVGALLCDFPLEAFTTAHS
jgi:hypothetical protein